RQQPVYATLPYCLPVAYLKDTTVEGAIQVRRRDRSVSSAQGVQYDHWSNTAGKTCVGLVDRNALKKICLLAHPGAHHRINLYRCGHGAVGFFGGIYWRRRLICIPEFSGHLRRHRSYPAVLDGQMDSTHVSQTFSHHVAGQYCLISVSFYSAWI